MDMSPLPCNANNSDNIYYKGKKSFENNRCSKCEYIYSIEDFINKYYPNYTLETCCDIEISKDKQPEAILISRDGKFKRIAIEVKSIPQMLSDNLNRDDKMRRENCYFLDRFLNEIETDVLCGACNALRELKIQLNSEIVDLFMNGLLIKIFLRQPNNITVKDAFLAYKGKDEIELRNKIVDNCTQYILGNIYSTIKHKKFLPCHSFTIDNFDITIGKTDIKSPISAMWCGSTNDFWSTFTPQKNMIDAKVNKFLDECQLKFEQYNADNYKRILLLDNDNKYSKEKLVSILQEKEYPNCVDEVWSKFYIYEETWNEKMEDFDGEEVVGFEYVKIYPIDKASNSVE